MIQTEQFSPESASALANVLGQGGDKRRRNELMRGLQSGQYTGTDTAGFQKATSDLKNQTGDFGSNERWAGAKLASNQNFATQSPDLYNIFGSMLTKDETGYNYYGDADPTTASWFDYKNPGQYQVKDLGLGKYDIYNGTNSLGTGYKSLDDAIYSYARSNAEKNIQSEQVQAAPTYSGSWWLNQGQPQTSTKYYYEPQWDPSNPLSILRSVNSLVGTPATDENGNVINNRKYYDSKDAILAELESLGEFKLESKEKYGRPINDLMRWDTLSGLMSGTQQNVKDWTYHRDATSNETADRVSGTNALYGSKPLIWNGKVVGYNQDFGPLPTSDPWYKDPRTMYAADTSGNTRSSSMIQMALDPNMSKYLSGLGDEHAFINASDASSLPGFTMPSGATYSHTSSGFIPKLASKLAPIAPFLNFIPGWGPIAANVIGGINAVNNDNPLGLLTSVVGGVGNLGGFSELSNSFQGLEAVKSLSELTGLTTAQLASGAGNALISAIGSGNLTQGAISGLASMFGGKVGNVTGSQGIGNVAKTAASFGLKDLYNKRNETEGASSVSNLMSSYPVNSGPQAQQVTPEQEEITRRKQAQQFALNNIYRQQANG